jgi:hypothetical protein
VKISLVSLAIALFFLSIGYFLFLNNKNANNLTSDANRIEKSSHSEDSSKIDKNTPPKSYTVKENKYYVVYVKLKNGGSSFVPEELNPNYKNDSDYHVTISFDDNGNIIDKKKVIEIDNFSISSENKEQIKKIAGVEKYDEALKEIQERVLQIKKSIPSL